MVSSDGLMVRAEEKDADQGKIATPAYSFFPYTHLYIYIPFSSSVGVFFVISPNLSPTSPARSFLLLPSPLPILNFLSIKEINEQSADTPAAVVADDASAAGAVAEGIGATAEGAEGAGAGAEGAEATAEGAGAAADLAAAAFG